MQILTANNTFDSMKVTKPVKEHPEIVKNLPRYFRDKSTNMVNIVDKHCKADAEENTAQGTLTKFIHNLEDTHGPLTEKLQEVD